jgi:hypothetical protein
MSEQIPKLEIEKKLGEYSPFFGLNILTLPESAQNIVEAFCYSASLVCKAVRINRRVTVTFGVPPFKIVSGQDSLIIDLKEPTINVTFGDFVFLDCLKMQSMPHWAIVTAILEELVHSLMNVNDERVAKSIVTTLYPDVEASATGQYGLKKQNQNHPK